MKSTQRATQKDENEDQKGHVSELRWARYVDRQRGALSVGYASARLRIGFSHVLHHHPALCAAPWFDYDIQRT